MCLLAVYHRAVPGAPVLVAANREELFDRPWVGPHLDRGILCGIDRTAGGTWLGVNKHGLLVAVTNRPCAEPPPSPRSRGLLCRDLLACRRAADAARRAASELDGGRYAGANYLCVDSESGWVVSGGDRRGLVELSAGLHLLTNGDLDDPADDRQTLARALLGAEPPTSAREFAATASRVCAHERIVVRAPDHGTVSCEVVALTDDSQDAMYLHAPGPPDTHTFLDCSALLQELLLLQG